MNSHSQFRKEKEGEGIVLWTSGYNLEFYSQNCDIGTEVYMQTKEVSREIIEQTHVCTGISDFSGEKMYQPTNHLWTSGCIFHIQLKHTGKSYLYITLYAIINADKYSNLQNKTKNNKKNIEYSYETTGNTFLNTKCKS